MIPTTTIFGVIDSVETPTATVTTLNIATYVKDEKLVFPVKWFKERATRFAENAGALIGKEIVVLCNIGSREHNGKFYLDLKGAEYGFKSSGSSKSAPPPPPPPSRPDDDDLPF